LSVIVAVPHHRSWLCHLAGGTFLRAGRVAKLPGLPIALHADASIGVARLYERETTTFLRLRGSDVGGVAEVSPEALKQF
jgi:hypothetical protein